MHRLSGGLVLGFHGCAKSTARQLLAGKPFRPSRNDYDWLGEGIYFWESNPRRGLEFVREKMKREGHKGPVQVVGAVLDLGLCLDLTTSAGIDQTRSAFDQLRKSFHVARTPLPRNKEYLKPLDCAVINYLHQLRASRGLEAVQTVRGVFIEGGPAYEGAGIAAKTHIQLAVRDPTCIKGVFRVADHVMSQG